MCVCVGGVVIDNKQTNLHCTLDNDTKKQTWVKTTPLTERFPTWLLMGNLQAFNKIWNEWDMKWKTRSEIPGNLPKSPQAFETPASDAASWGREKDPGEDMAMLPP